MLKFSKYHGLGNDFILLEGRFGDIPINLFKNRADLVITVGAVQSNHARQTAAACTLMGLKCLIVLEQRLKNPPDAYMNSGNVFLNKLFGADVKICPKDENVLQYTEKLIPMVIYNILNNKNIPVYGNGKQIRDWIYVYDHVEALIKIAKFGRCGDNYNIGCNNEIRNIDIIYKICKILSNINYKLNNKKKDYRKLIKFVKDRPGHDFRYALNNRKIKKEINWLPQNNFHHNLVDTIKWYLNNIYKL